MFVQSSIICENNIANCLPTEILTYADVVYHMDTVDYEDDFQKNILTPLKTKGVIYNREITLYYEPYCHYFFQNSYKKKGAKQ